MTDLPPVKGMGSDHLPYRFLRSLRLGEEMHEMHIH